MDIPRPPQQRLDCIDLPIFLELLQDEADAGDRETVILADHLCFLGSFRNDPMDDAEALDAEELDALQTLEDLFAPVGDLLNGRAYDGNLANREWEEEEAELRRHLEELESRTIYLNTAKRPKDAAIMGEILCDSENPLLAAFSLDGGQVIIGAGVPGAGKSQAALCLAESALRSIRGISSADSIKRAVIAIHTDLEGDRLPQMIEALYPNKMPADLEHLKKTFHQDPAPIPKIRVVIPRILMDHYAERLRPYVEAGLDVKPLHIPFSQLNQSALQILIAGNHPDSLYVQHILDEARALGDRLTIEELRKRIDEAGDMNATQKCAAHRRLRLLEEVTSQEKGQDPSDLWDLVEPGTLTIFMLGGTQIGNDAFPLAATIVSAIMQPSDRHGAFQRVFIVDEANNFDDTETPWAPIVRLGRQIRHAGSILILLGQDLNRLPTEVLGLASLMIIFHLGNEKIYHHIQSHLGGFSQVPFSQIFDLKPGTAAVVTLSSWGEGYVPNPYGNQARFIHFRPPLAQHGGHTKAAV